MKIYVASSWRNEFQQQVVQNLRKDGHAVYDFREDGDGWGRGDHGPGGFGWHEVGGPNWKNWVNDIPSYLAALDHPRAEEGFRRDMDALERSDACVMVHPCGVSAAMETGWACGAGKKVYVYVPGLREPDLMVKMAALVTNDFARIRAKLSEGAGADTPTPTLTPQLLREMANAFVDVYEFEYTVILRCEADRIESNAATKTKENPQCR